ncbi:MAG: hypothetical protein ACYTGB_13295 [Planctomycetota bacterium]|jgi:hypothetical protein
MSHPSLRQLTLGTAAGALSALLLIWAAPARAGAPAPAGQPAVAPAGTPAPAGAPAPAGTPAPGGATAGEPGTGAVVKKEIFPERPDAHYEPRDRVDPFTLGRPPEPDAPPIPEPPDQQDPGDAPKTPWGRKLAEVRSNYAHTEIILSAETKDRFTKVGSLCQKHIPVLENDIRELLKNEGDAAKFLNSFQAMLEKFQRLESTAKRLALRQEVEADFASKKIVVEGIVWRPQAPAAAVNGQMVKEGSVLQVGGGKKGGVGIIQVYRIRRDSVVFMYRGIQVSAHLQRGSL